MLASKGFRPQSLWSTLVVWVGTVHTLTALVG
jgi:hypothetical protein